MTAKAHPGASPFPHGAAELPLVDVDTYNEELSDEDGFIGDRASRRAFRLILDDWRERIRELGDPDPLGATPSEEIPRRMLDQVLQEGEPLAAGVLHTAIEDFASELSCVVRRFLHLEGWRGTERIVVGGGLRASRVGEVAIGRAAVLVKHAGLDVEIVPIRHDPDEAGLVGCVHLAPSWVLRGCDAMLGVDIGGSKIRAGIVALALDEAPDLSRAHVVCSEIWRHAEQDPPPGRDDAVAHIVELLAHMTQKAEEDGLHLAPVVGIGCPGVIRADGSIDRGGHNLPGDWESDHFNLAERLRGGLPRIGGHETRVVLHNDAVVQGLSEAPYMRDVDRWGVLTIGTGLGNARFTNRRTADRESGTIERGGRA